MNAAQLRDQRTSLLGGGGGGGEVPPAAELKSKLKGVIDARAGAVDAARAAAGNASSTARSAASALTAARAAHERLKGELRSAEAAAAAEGDLLPEPPETPAASAALSQRAAPSRFDAYEQSVTDSDAAVTKAENDLSVGWCKPQSF